MSKSKAASDVHEGRESETRNGENLHPMAEAPWSQPASLEAPPPRPGMVQRWIRVGTMGKDDPTNTSRKLREGWVPRKPESVPPDFPLPRIENGKFAGCIGIEGSILCEMSIARNNERNKYFSARRQRMTDAINDQLAATNERVGAGFGRITKDERSVPVREVAVQSD